ncbi:MAG: biotin transporter BioY [Bacillota bacterium]
MKLTIREYLLAALFAALTAIGAFISIPLAFYPVPMTLQTLFVFLAGLCLRPRAALWSQIVYVAVGLIGIPIFARGGGIQYVLNPTFGFLLAFVIAAPLISVAARKYLFAPGNNLRFALCAAGIALGIEALGIAYMLLISAFYIGTPLAAETALYLLVIFLPLDLVKLAVSTGIAVQLKKRLSGLIA